MPQTTRTTGAGPALESAGVILRKEHNSQIYPFVEYKCVDVSENHHFCLPLQLLDLMRSYMNVLVSVVCARVSDSQLNSK